MLQDVCVPFCLSSQLCLSVFCETTQVWIKLGCRLWNHSWVPFSVLWKWALLEHISEVSWPPTHKDFLEPSHGRVFRESFTLFMWWRVLKSCSHICLLTGYENLYLQVFTVQLCPHKAHLIETYSICWISIKMNLLCWSAASHSNDVLFQLHKISGNFTWTWNPKKEHRVHIISERLPQA